ncbi:MAG: PilZ domain-containing protein [Desulfovibrio aminophilus]|uniref:PilZ domain-containing protein n=1 Tax=Desulfovibrio aminophilus TaxID=81425 RepID=UPI0039EA3B35
MRRPPDIASLRVLLVAEPGDARSAYEQELARLGVTFDAIDGPGGRPAGAEGRIYNGILLDLPTWIRCPARDRENLQAVLEHFPVLRLLHNQEQGGIRGVSLGATVRQARDMDGFLLKECAGFHPRPLRMSDRHDVSHSVLILRGPDQASEQGERAVTTNVSATGCFMVAFGVFEVGQKLWLLFPEENSPDQGGPVRCVVRWFRPWGVSRRLPGIGVAFEDSAPVWLQSARATTR